jgi:hypothetical protein
MNLRIKGAGNFGHGSEVVKERTGDQEPEPQRIERAQRRRVFLRKDVKEGSDLRSADWQEAYIPKEKVKGYLL